jgi:hypothetical protein
MQLQHRGMLIHVTHIDPEWLKHKDTEGPFDLPTAMELLPLMARYGMLMTQWIKCDAANKDTLVSLLNTAGPGYM